MASTFPDSAMDSHDLHKENPELAYEKSHDADITSNASVRTPTATTTPALSADIEKGPESHSARLSGEEVAAGESSQDPNIVWWDEPSDRDPANPMNWSGKVKWGNMSLISLMTLITPLASSMFAPGVPEVMKDFHSTNEDLATFVVSVYILGFAFGPLVIAPLSEMYGRRWIYNICNALFVVFTVACAVSDSLGMLIGFRFLAGCVGAVPVTLGGGSIADLMPAEKRGGVMAVWALGPLLGPVIGPICGGFLVQAKSWRWVFWVLAIVSGAISIISSLLLRETYGPVLLKRKAARLRKETGNPNLHSKLDTGITHKDLFLQSIVRPMKMLFLSPIVALLSVYTAIAYGILYLLFTTFTYVFMQQYSFSQGVVGLSFLGIGIGMFIGLGIFGGLSNKIAAKHAAKGDLKPEHRLPIYLTVPGGLCLPVGLFIYGWTVEKKVHWFVPIFGTSFVGMGLISIMMCIQTYLIDAFTVYAASAIAANTVLRSLLGALLPLCGLRMYNKLGLDWGNSMLAFIALALAPLPALFRIYGERIRTHPKFQLKL